MSSINNNDLTTNIGNLPAVIGEVFNRIFPIQLNATGTDPNLTIVRDITLQDTASAPTRQINMSAGDDAVPGEHFGLDWISGGQPFIINTLDATDLQILDTTLQLEQTTGTPQTTDITATDISIVGGNSATWANIINNVGGGIPSLSQVLTVGQSAGLQNISSVNDLGVTSINGFAYQPFSPETLQAVVNTSNAISNFTIPNTATITSTNFTSNRQLILNDNTNPTIQMIDNLNASHYTTYDIDTLNLNGVSYNWSSIVVGGATPNINSVLSAGNNTSGFSIDFNNNSNIDNVVNINGAPYPPYPTAPYGLLGVLSISNDAVGSSITGVNNIDLININGSVYPPPTSSQDLQTTLGYGTSAGSYSINMNSQYIGSCNDVGLVSINGIPFLPAKFSYVFQTFSLGSMSSGVTNLYGGVSSPTIPVGTYQITYSIQLDGNVIQSVAQYYSVKGYCFLQGASFGQVYPYKVNQGVLGATLMAYNSGYPNQITITDIIQISTADTFQLGAYQENELSATSYTSWISAIIESV